MSLEIKEVITKNDIKQFVDFQFQLYKNNPMWVPPLRKAEIKSLIPEQNPAFEDCISKFWIVIKNKQCVGRVGGIINRKYNEKMNIKMARFSRIEFIDDIEVSELLIKTVEDWAKQQGMLGVHGPLGFSNLDTQAMLIEGFDYLPSVASVYHLPYYQKHIERLGYIKEIDWVEFRITIPTEIPEKALRVAEMIKQRYGLIVKKFSTTKELLPYAKEMFRVLNNAFAELFSVAPFNDKLAQYYIDKYITMLNPNFVTLIFDKENKLGGFIIGVPSLSRAMQKANGSLFPFGFYYILKALKHPKEIDLFLTAVEPHLQGLGYTAILIAELQKTCMEYGVTHVETTGMIETNQKAIQHWKNFDHIQHKRKRCFIKMFS